MKKQTKRLCCLSAIIFISVTNMLGCNKKEDTEEATNTTSTTEYSRIEYPTKEQVTIDISDSDPTDGDMLYRTPANYNRRNDETTYGEVVTVQYYSTTVGKDRDVSIVLPPNYSVDKEYPVLYLFHGLGQDNTQWIKDGKADVIIGNMLASGECEEMIIVAPNCRARENDAGNPADEYSDSNFMAFETFYFEFLTDLKPFIERNYPVKTGRENTAIAGFSRGGLISLRLGFCQQDMFGYIGSFNVPADLFGYYTMHDEPSEDYVTYETFNIKDEYADDTYIAIVGGKSDTVVSGPEFYHSILDEYGVEHFFCMYSGGHDFGVADKGFYYFAKELFK